jgi:hypothetical protein
MVSQGEHGYPLPPWAVKQIKHEVCGLVENICQHGYAHPSAEWLRKYPRLAGLGYGDHGCDGCCTPGKYQEK